MQRFSRLVTPRRHQHRPRHLRHRSLLSLGFLRSRYPQSSLARRWQKQHRRLLCRRGEKLVRVGRDSEEVGGRQRLETLHGSRCNGALYPFGRPRTSKGACAIPPDERKRPRRRNTSQPSIRACWLRSIEGLAEEFHDLWYEDPIALRSAESPWSSPRPAANTRSCRWAIGARRLIGHRNQVLIAGMYQGTRPGAAPSRRDQGFHRRTSPVLHDSGEGITSERRA